MPIDSHESARPLGGGTGANDDDCIVLRPLLVDRREAGRVLGVSAGTIDNLRSRGELPSLKLGARRLYDLADLYRLIDARKAVTR